MKNAYFAGGCFWCITPVFYDIAGVANVVSGYSGGDEADPTYEQVKHQLTGHRETICIEYDETKAKFAQLLEVYLKNVDAFDEGGQFIDRGRSYTTAIYWQDEEEKTQAERALAALEAEAGKKCAIAVEPFKSFYSAEDFHQNYFRTHPEEFAKEMAESGRCTIVL